MVLVLIISELSSEIIVGILVSKFVELFFEYIFVKTKVPTTTPLRIINAVLSDIPPKFFNIYSLILSLTFITFFLNELKSKENSYSSG